MLRGIAQKLAIGRMMSWGGQNKRTIRSIKSVQIGGKHIAKTEKPAHLPVFPLVFNILRWMRIWQKKSGEIKRDEERERVGSNEEQKDAANDGEKEAENSTAEGKYGETQREQTDENETPKDNPIVDSVMNQSAHTGDQGKLIGVITLGTTQRMSFLPHSQEC